MFYRFRRTIHFLVRVFGFLPKPLLRFLYRLAEPFNGLFFVLVRYLVLANLCRRCGDNVFVGGDVEIKFFENLSIGNNVSIHRSCYVDALGGIEIGNDVSIAHQTSLVAFEHGWDDTSIPIRKNPLIAKPISIADDVWIGAGVRLLAGARIATRCVVAAGSVVTAKTEPKAGYVLAGIPATPKKALPMAGRDAADAPVESERVRQLR
ncbi:MAG: acyltransferase [Pseudomonadota bacterium]